MEKVVGGLSDESFIQHQIDRQAGIVAAADPLPGPLEGAFIPNDIEALGQKIRPLVAYDWAIMKKLNSPIYRQMMEVMQKGPTAVDVESAPEELWDLIFLLSRPCEEADTYFKKGLEAFHEQAKREIGMKYGLGQILVLVKACTDQIYAHMQTMLAYVPKEDKDGEVKNFPPADPTPATASAGG
jgi:hypothetical protein